MTLMKDSQEGQPECRHLLCSCVCSGSDILLHGWWVAMLCCFSKMPQARTVWMTTQAMFRL